MFNWNGGNVCTVNIVKENYFIIWTGVLLDCTDSDFLYLVLLLNILYLEHVGTVHDMSARLTF
jgi:hypothetical protein